MFENRQQVADELSDANRQHDVDEFDLLFKIPWSHHTQIIDKVRGGCSQGPVLCPQIVGEQLGQMCVGELPFIRPLRTSRGVTNELCVDNARGGERSGAGTAEESL